MQIDEQITSLNNRKGIFIDRLGNFSYPDMHEEERKFMAQFQPEKAFIIYGSLAPGGPNHNFVKNIPGEWKKGFVTGKLENKGWGADMGYKGYRPVPTHQQEQIPAHILFSAEMGTHWRRLDEFEGEGYLRQLARFTLEDGQEGVGYIYGVRWDIY
jgi:gamma-glutamylcyclotransferase (GGCT)/AIG2-like uncharacterized protein YtfP